MVKKLKQNFNTQLLWASELPAPATPLLQGKKLVELKVIFCYRDKLTSDKMHTFGGALCLTVDSLSSILACRGKR